MQNIYLPTLNVIAEQIGRNYFPGYRAPFAIQPIMGASRLKITCGSNGILFAISGTLLNEDEGTCIKAPFLTTACGSWVSSPDSLGWIGAFHPRVINQEFADWPRMNQAKHDDPLLKRDRELLESIMPQSQGKPTPVCLNLTGEEAIYLNRMFSNMIDLLENQSDAYWPCRSRSCFLEVLFFLWKRPEHIVQGASVSRPDLVHEWLRTHYPEKITIPDLASRFGTNRTSLQEQFKKRFGTSIIDFLGEIRTEAACILMRNTELSLSEIGIRVGFSDYSNFYREFRQRYALPPRQYRKTCAPIRIY